jgi:hypothetical protein
MSNPVAHELPDLAPEANAARSRKPFAFHRSACLPANGVERVRAITSTPRSR